MNTNYIKNINIREELKNTLRSWIVIVTGMTLLFTLGVASVYSTSTSWELAWKLPGITLLYMILIIVYGVLMGGYDLSSKKIAPLLGYGTLLCFEYGIYETIWENADYSFLYDIIEILIFFIAVSFIIPLFMLLLIRILKWMDPETSPNNEQNPNILTEERNDVDVPSKEIPEGYISREIKDLNKLSLIERWKLHNTHNYLINNDNFLFTTDNDDEYLAYCNDKLIECCRIPIGIQEIGTEAFINCSKMSSIYLPDTINIILNAAFFNCSSLKEIVLPPKIEYITELTFARCTQLTKIKLPENLTHICYRAFSECESLKIITIPSSVREIGECAFAWCTSLSCVVFLGSHTQVDKNSFYGCVNLETVVLPNSAHVEDGAFKGCSRLKNIVYVNILENSPIN